MAKKETTKPTKYSELNDSSPFGVFLGERIDVGIPRDIKACRSDKPESPRKTRKKTT